VPPIPTSDALGTLVLQSPLPAGSYDLVPTEPEATPAAKNVALACYRAVLAHLSGLFSPKDFAAFNAIVSMPGVNQAIATARRGGVPFIMILQVLLPFILAMMNGQPIDINAVIAAILALLNQRQPMEK
jgi:hypothetical protein